MTESDGTSAEGEKEAVESTSGPMAARASALERVAAAAGGVPRRGTGGHAAPVARQGAAGPSPRAWDEALEALDALSEQVGDGGMPGGRERRLGRFSPCPGHRT